MSLPTKNVSNQSFFTALREGEGPPRRPTALQPTKSSISPFNKPTGWAEVFNSIWNWVKFNLLFCVFDVKAEREEKLRQELGKFQDLYYALASIRDIEATEKIKRNFNRLNSSLQEKIKAHILRIIKKYLPDREQDFYSQKLKEVLDDPFLTIDKPGASTSSDPERNKISIFGNAITNIEIGEN